MQEEKFKLEKVDIDGKSQYRLEGIVDEDLDLSPLRNATGPLLLNLSGIKSINSLGIRGWVNFWKELENKEVYYLECPPIIVRQMSMIPSFTGSARVLSVYVPYVCDNCEAETLSLVTLTESQAPEVPETIPCKQCGSGEMELDANPKQYFSFKK